MRRPSWVPEGMDLDRPAVARVYDYYLGGSHNFAADREMAREAIAQWPELPLIMRANRAFLRRAVTYLAERGFTRFLDIGPGIPTFGAVHEVAREVQPESRVVYVDNDPVAVAHSRLLLEHDKLAAVVDADLTDPETLLARPEVAELLAVGEPVALLLVAVLHFVTDEQDPERIVRTLRDALPPGSALVLCHASSEGGADRMESHQALYDRTPTPMTMRPAKRIGGFFDGFELVDPGLVYLPQWRPDEPAEVDEHPERMVGVVGVGLLP